MEHKLVTVKTGKFMRPADNNLYEIRRAMVDARTANDKAAATIFVQGFNRIEKTKQCVESILKHTKDVEFRLLLVDSGSSDGTLEYFKTVPHENTVILHFPENVSSSFTQAYFYPYIEGRYLVQVNNDIMVTPRWLSNLIKCAESDIRIGMVNPVSSNVSNFQQVDLEFKTMAEMESAADKYNVSNPLMWEEHMRLITLGTLYKRECLEAVGYLFDTGFMHDFADDDISYRIRHAGYKLMIAKDTWVHHNHDFRNFEDKNPEEFLNGLQLSRRMFTEKYHGIEAWDDFITVPVKPEHLGNVKGGSLCALGIDCKIGYPLLALKNALMQNGARQVVLSAFDQESKFYTDLKSICDGITACDREEFITNHFAENQFDYVIVGRPINEFHEPYKLLQDIARLSKNGAKLVFTLKNTFGTNTLDYMKTCNPGAVKSYALSLPVEVVSEWLRQIGYVNGSAEPKNIFDDQKEWDETVKNINKFCTEFKCGSVAGRIAADNYLIAVTLTK